jgi:hypothetical protein
MTQQRGKTRFERALEKLVEVDGAAGKEVVEPLLPGPSNPRGPEIHSLRRPKHQGRQAARATRRIPRSVLLADRALAQEQT